MTYLAVALAPSSVAKWRASNTSPSGFVSAALWGGSPSVRPCASPVPTPAPPASLPPGAGAVCATGVGPIVGIASPWHAVSATDAMARAPTVDNTRHRAFRFMCPPPITHADLSPTDTFQQTRPVAGMQYQKQKHFANSCGYHKRRRSASQGCGMRTNECLRYMRPGRCWLEVGHSDSAGRYGRIPPQHLCNSKVGSSARLRATSGRRLQRRPLARKARRLPPCLRARCPARGQSRRERHRR